MPPIARIVGLILIGISPAALVAQTSPVGESLASDYPSTEEPPWASTSANRPTVAPPSFARPVYQPAPAESVVPAAYEASSAEPSRALGNGTAGAPQSPPVDNRTPTVYGDAAMPLGPRDRRASVPLPARGEKSETATNRRGLDMALTTGGALALVVGLILVLAWAARRAAPRGSSLLPGEVVEVLGRAPLANRQQIHLLRCGHKLLLVSVTPTGAETLTEITDPMEVDRLAGLCQQAQPGSATAAFRNVLQQFNHEPGDSRRAEDDGIGASGMLSDHRRRSWEGSDV